MKRKLSEKILTLDQAARRMENVDAAFTNGCFDILHDGHCQLLEQAAELAQLLVVAVNSDESVRQLKGPTRPVNDQWSRMMVVAALECVDIVVVLDALRCDKLIRKLRPGIWVKGGDYTIDTLDPDERKAAEHVKSKIKILPLVHGRSTTATIKALAAAH